MRNRAFALIVFALSGVVAWDLHLGTPAFAATSLTVQPITWNVIGLDSNNVAQGPATYPVGARVCNVGSDPSTTTSATFVWTTTNPAIELEGPATVSIGTLAPSTCRDAYWNVNVVRADSSYETTRSYEIRVTSAEGAAATTPSPRELYVERLISQNRNSVNAITGPTSVTVGDEVTYTVDADTAEAGFEQLEAFLTLPSSIFQLLRVGVTYEKPTGGVNDSMYADGCGWDPVPTSPTYLSCIGPERYAGGKVGGALLSTFTVRVIGTGTATLTSAIYDKSGSSFHYNTDFSVRPNLLIVTASAPAPSTTTTTTTTTTPLPAPTTSTPAAAEATSLTPAPPASASTALNTRTASPAVAATGRSDTGSLSLMGSMLVAVGLLALATSRAGETMLAVTALDRSRHDLRRTLHGHDHDAVAARAWLLMDALDRVARALDDSGTPNSTTR